MIWFATVSILLTVFLFGFTRHMYHLIFLLDARKQSRSVKLSLEACVRLCLEFNDHFYAFSPKTRGFVDGLSDGFLKSSLKYFLAARENGQPAQEIVTMFYAACINRQNQALKKLNSTGSEIKIMGWTLTLLMFTMIYGGISPFPDSSANSLVIGSAVLVFVYGLVFSHFLINPVHARLEQELIHTAELRDVVEMTLRHCQQGKSSTELDDCLKAYSKAKKSDSLVAA